MSNFLQVPSQGSQGPSQNARKLINEELTSMGLQLNMKLTMDELYVLLDTKIGGKTFDRGIANQLYEQIEKDNTERFTLNDFVNVYLEAEMLLRQKIAETNTNINGFQSQRQEAYDQLKEQQKQERLNEYGIMEDSILLVSDIEVTDLKSAFNRDIYVRVSCEENSFQTNSALYKQNATWNDQFKGEIKTGQDDVQLVVFAIEATPDSEESEVLGGVGVPLARFRNQHKHDEWFDLYDQKGIQTGGRIHANFHWIHSRVQFISSLIKAWDEQLSALNEDKEDFQRDLNILYEIFPTLVGRKSVRDPSIPLEKLRPEPETTGEKAFSKLEYKESPTKAYPLEIVSARELVVSWKRISLWGLLAFYASIALVILGVFGCYHKPDFLDILLGIAFLSGFNHERVYSGTAIRVLLFVIGTLIALVWELFWFGHFAWLWSKEEGDWDMSQDETRFEIVIRFFSVIVKIILAICHFFFYQFLMNWAKTNPENVSSIAML